MLNELGDDDLQDFAYDNNTPFKYFFEKYFDFKRFESKLSNRKSFDFSRGITTNGVKIFSCIMSIPKLKWGHLIKENSDSVIY